MLVRSAASLCGCDHAAIYLREGESLGVAALYGATQGEVDGSYGRYIPIDRKTISGRVALSGKLESISDVHMDPNYDYAPIQKWSHARAMLGAPLLRNGEVLGVLSVARPEPGSFSQRQYALLQTFAEQAEVAIGNAHLFSELEQRTRNLSDALKQQTATAEVLKTISRTAFDLPAVLKTLVTSAASLCEARFGGIFLRDGKNTLRGFASLSEREETWRDDQPLPIDRTTISGRVVLSGCSQYSPDVDVDPEYDTAPLRNVTDSRALLGVPLFKEGRVEGVFFLGRPEPASFTDRHKELLETFADQAMIAIENTRLFREVDQRSRELQETLDFQLATSEVLNVISRSPSNLEPVLEIIVKTARRLCDADRAMIMQLKGDRFKRVARDGTSVPEFDRLFDEFPVAPGRGSLAGRALIEKDVVQIEDAQADPEYKIYKGMEGDPRRTMLGVPLLKDGEVIGVIVMSRSTVKLFSQRQVDLVSTFADQAVIAINNVGLFEEVQRRNAELSETLERQTATGTILRAIAGSPTDVQPVLDAVAESAAKLCRAFDAVIFIKQGNELAWKAHFGGIPMDFVSRPIGRDWVTGRAFVDRRVIHIEDVSVEGDEYPLSQSDASRLGNRTLLAVPMLRDSESIGVIVIRRLQVQPFTQGQIDLLTTFADQAVIAIENVRLFEEVKQRNSDLVHALERQTATSAILRAIAGSPTDVKPVLAVVAENAARLCDGFDVVVGLREDNWLTVGAHYGSIPLPAGRLPLQRDWPAGRAVLDGRPVNIDDLAQYEAEFSFGYKLAMNHGFRTSLAIPIMRAEEAIGVIGIRRLEVRPFTASQIDLLTTFASQAAIAIENVRLFDEVQRRSLELQEALDYQTATSDVLKTISQSAFDLDSVLHTLVKSSLELCRATGGNIHLRNGDVFQTVQQVGWPKEFQEYMRRNPLRADHGTIAGRAIVTKSVVHIRDVLEDPDYQLTESQKIAGYRSLMGVPLIRDGEVIGIFSLGRDLPEPFTQREVDLVQTFSDQAVIAIANVRLFEQVQARTRDLARSVAELKAHGEVSQSVNSTLDLKTVLETIVAKAVQLSETDAGAIYVYNRSEDRFRLRATFGMSADLIKAISQQTIKLTDPGIGAAALQRIPIQTPDLAAISLSPAQRIILEAGYRSLLVVPLLGPNKIVGTLVVRRREPGEFPSSTVELMQTFAAQSVLAIQNARLFNEIEEKGRQLEVASRHKSQFLANMSHELRTPLNSVLGFTEMLVDGLYGDLPEKARIALSRIETNGKHLLELINDVLDLSKIEAGQLQLAFDDYVPAQMVKSAAMVAEALASAKGLSLSVKVAEGMPVSRGDERRLTQVLINLLGNAVKFTESGSVQVVALAVDGQLEISVCDTGPGIAPEHHVRIFEEFQQVDDSNTRKKGGSGLGLAISKRIVEMHGGSISLHSSIGVGSTFTVTLPIKALEREAKT